MADGTDQPAFGTVRLALWTTIVGCLLLPFLAMQVTDEVTWSGFDFVAAAVLLFGAGGAFELLLHSRISRRSRIIIGAAVASAVAVIWAQGAVGVI
ncbi:hypothetical protein [Novosphingobium sp. JCM 18896]|uniref:hypothetical protein n=1 Tax=Novosphingobium sp. JCM 18896 TaxID=2989731 RepID=UPI002222032E|nr:hypothetical protein [Novosphingobium sp. JCM 18896]MCW1431584.1 hypothetical protein [Novosphingobium sp. JCM 18896]